MSTVNNKEGKSNFGKKKRKQKRKAVSPLKDTSKTSKTELHGDGANVDKNVSYVPEKLYTDFDSNCVVKYPVMNTPMNTPMNIPGAVPVGGQISPMAFMYQTPMVPGYSQQQPQPSASSSQPEWATELIKEVRSLKAGMQKIDQTVTSISAKIGQIESRIQTLDTRMGEVETSCSFIHDQFETQKTDIAESQRKMKSLQEKCEQLENNASRMAAENTRFESKLLDMESRSMRENLLFLGLRESGHEENCESIVKQFCQESLCLPEDEVKKIEIDRAHRIGKRSTDRTRPIVVKFHQYSTRERIRQRGIEMRDMLKSKNLAVRQQWPKEVVERRKSLFPVMDREREKGKNVKLVRDKLYINGVEYQQD